MVAQGSHSGCLRDYHTQRGVTMLLTSHYMRDVEALCDRVLVINHGALVYDGPLSGIVERFSETKLVKLQFERPGPGRSGRFGEVVRREGPWADIKVERARVAERAGGDSRPSRPGRRERGRPAARGSDRQGLRGGPARP